MITRESAGARRFDGLAPWAVRFVLFAWVGWGLAWIVYVPLRLETIALIVTAPLVTLFVAAWAAFLIAFHTKTIWSASAQSLVSFAPLAALPGVLTALAGVFKIGGAFQLLPVSGALFAFITFGLLPAPLAPFGVLLSLALVAVLLWKLLRRAGVAPVHAALTLAAFWVGVWLVLLVPSLCAWLGLGQDASVWGAGSTALARGLTAFVHDGYWWRAVYERFPGAVGGEIRTSTSYLLAALSVLAASTLAGAWLSRQWRFSWDALARLLRPVPFSLEGVWMLLGALLAVFLAHPPTGSTIFLATLLLATSFFSGWVAERVREDLAALPALEQRNDPSPLVQGELSPSVARGALPLLSAVQLVSAWVLGWPVFVALGIRFLSGRARNLFPEGLPGRYAALPQASVQAVSGASLAAVGWFLASGTITLERPVLGLALALFLILFIYPLAGRTRTS